MKVWSQGPGLGEGAPESESGFLRALVDYLSCYKACAVHVIG